MLAPAEPGVDSRDGIGSHRTAARDDSRSLVDLALEQLALEAEHVGSVARLALAEAKLSLVGAGTILIGTLVAAALALTTWGLLVAAAALWLRSTGLAIEPILIGIAVLHAIAVWAILAGLRRIGRAIGFADLQRHLGQRH